MQPPAVGIKVDLDVKGQDLCVESLSILQVIVSNLVNDAAEKFGNTMFGCFVPGVVVEAGFVGGFGANTDNSCGIVTNVLVIEGEARQPDKLCAAMGGFVLGGLCKDDREGMDS